MRYTPSVWRQSRGVVLLASCGVILMVGHNKSVLVRALGVLSALMSIVAAVSARRSWVTVTPLVIKVSGLRGVSTFEVAETAMSQSAVYFGPIARGVGVSLTDRTGRRVFIPLSPYSKASRRRLLDGLSDAFAGRVQNTELLEPHAGET
jgi:hypothetical protein